MIHFLDIDPLKIPAMHADESLPTAIRDTSVAISGAIRTHGVFDDALFPIVDTQDVDWCAISRGNTLWALTLLVALVEEWARRFDHYDADDNMMFLADRQVIGAATDLCVYVPSGRVTGLDQSTIDSSRENYAWWHSDYDELNWTGRNRPTWSHYDD